MRKLFPIVATILLLASCERAPEEIAVSAVAITQPTAEMIVGEKVQLQVSITPSNATDKSVLWSSSKQSVATVNNDGLVTAIAAGNTTITAAAGGKFGTCLVTVSKGFVAVTSVSLNTAKITLVEEETTTLTATVLPEDATDKSVVWTSSAGDVATVKDGLVTALKAGTCTITAKAGEKIAQCTVEVKPKVIVVTEVSLNKSKLSLVEGDSETLVATVKPDNATDKSVSWSSSNEAIATVTSSGKVTALKEGTAVITASAGDKQAICVVEVSKKVIPVSLVSLNKTSLTLEKGKSENLVATVNPTNATDKSVTWSSSNTQVASVNQDGLVIAVNNGSAVITAKAGDKTATCAVTVVVPVENVSLSPSSVTMEEGQTTTLTATVYPSDATDKTVTWTSDNTYVASVSNGKVTALKEGTAVITAKAGNKTSTCTVTVKKKYIAVTSVTLNKTTLSLTKGSSETLTATAKPDNATDKTVTWSSSNVAVASVDQNGKVYAVGGGNAVITAKAGDKTATCSVTVTVPVETVTLSQTTLELVEEQSATLTATVYPSDATDKTVTWSSSNTSVATVSNGKVTAIKEGSVTISAKAGNITATCSVTVTKKYIAVTSVTLNKTTLSLTKGASETLTATVKPDDATDKTVTWSSSNPQVASIDQNGKVYAVGGGTSIIMAKAGDKSATCSVTVTVPVETIVLSQTTMELIEEQSATLSATVYPSDATDKTVTWSSSNTSVATVSNGKVTAIKEGNATISAKAGNITATCSVTVTKKYIAVTSITLNKSSLSLTKGSSETLVATVNPADATNPTVTWATSNSSVASVNQNGKVSAVGGGSATITAKAGDMTATCSVTVTVPVSGVSVSSPSVSLIQGETQQLTATVYPADATNPAVTWSSSNTTIASVSANGLLTANTPGTATITVKTQDGGYTATCTVTVNEKPKATALSLSTGSFEAIIGQHYNVSVTASPADAYCEYEWTSGNADVATISGNGNTADILTKGYGEVVITVKEKRSGLTASITVSTVVTDFAWNITAEKTYNGYPLFIIHINEKLQLNYTCTPSSVTNLFSDLSQFTFLEQGSSVASPTFITLSETGEIKGLKIGITGIEAKGRIRTNSTQRIYIRVIDNGNTEPIDDDENEHGWD